MSLSTGGVRPRRGRRQGGVDRDFAYDAANAWPQPTWVPQTAPGVATLDDFNTGATQLLTARTGWSSVGVVIPGDISWRTDATPTLADTTLTPASGHSNLWNTAFATNQEAWAFCGAVGGVNSDLSVILNSTTNSAGGSGGFYRLSWIRNNASLQMQGTPTVTVSTIMAAVPAVGDGICLQHDGDYLFGWAKLAAGNWTLILCSPSGTVPLTGGWIGMSQQAGGSISTDSFGGGSFLLSAKAPVFGFRRVWTGR